MVGNKEDLTSEAGGSDGCGARAAAAAFAQTHGMHTLTTSAKTGAGVSEAFIGLARILMSTAMPVEAAVVTTNLRDMSFSRRNADATCCGT